MKDILQLFPEIFEVKYHCAVKRLTPLIMQLEIIMKSIKEVLKK